MRAKFAAVVLGLFFGAGLAVAQDRTITIREVDVGPFRGEFDVMEGGVCVVTAYAKVAAPSVEPAHPRNRHPVDKALCAAVKKAIVTAAKKDLGVGDGSDP